MDLEKAQLAEAILLWTGWRQRPYPCRDDGLVASKYGSAQAAKLLPVIKLLEQDFYSSDARFIANDLQDMGKIAEEQFKKKHPDLPQEIATAFAWCYTFDYK